MLTAYIERNVPGLKMPRTEGERDDAGIRFKGEIGAAEPPRGRIHHGGKRLFQSGYRPWESAATCLWTLFFVSTAGWMSRIHGRIRGGRLRRPAALRRRVW